MKEIQGARQSLLRALQMEAPCNKNMGGLWELGVSSHHRQSDAVPSLTTTRDRILLTTGMNLGVDSSPGPPERKAAPAGTLNLSL